MRLLLSVLFVILCFLETTIASGQMAIDPWVVGPATPFDGGCTPNAGACDDCSETSAVGGNSVSLKVSGAVAQFGNFRCERGLRATTTLHIGPSATRLFAVSDLFGTLELQSIKPGFRSWVEATVYLDGLPLLVHGEFFQSVVGVSLVDDHRENTCLNLLPGDYAVEVRLLTDTSIAAPSPPCVGCPVNRTDFRSGNNGLVVSFVQAGLVGPFTPAPATITMTNSCTFPNPDVLSAIPPVIGRTWIVSLELGLDRSPSPWIVCFGGTLVGPCGGVPVPQITGALNFGTAAPGRMLLCSINTAGHTIVGMHDGIEGHVSTVGEVIPCNTSLIGFGFCAQAVVRGVVAPVDGGGNARLSSMVSGVVGSE